MIFLLSILIAFHGTPVSFFDFHLKGDEIKFTIEVENSHLGLITQAVDEDQVLVDINAYLSEKTSLELNGQQTSLNISSIEKRHNGHIILKGSFVSEHQTISSFQLKNEWLLEHLDDQINSVTIRQKGKDIRGFKMDTSRRSIDVVL